jgi:tetratricopeptide (TPR) repeat protein
VGRERELRALGDLLEECVSEPVARAALVTAPAGVGKSRLLYELSRQIERRGDAVVMWSGRGDPMGVGSAFSLIASALRGAASVREGEPQEEQRRKLERFAERYVAEKDRARIAAFLGEIMGAPFLEGESALLRGARANPAVMADQVRRAFEDLIAAACGKHPLVIALEDVHWGDVPSVKLVDTALGKLHDRPLLVVALGRPEVHERFPQLWAARGAQEIRLGALTRRAAERLARHALGEAAPADLVERIVARAGGHAFYLEELIRAAAEGRAEALPETVLAMVEARLAALDADDRRALRAASVFGETCWAGGVAALLGGEDPGARLAGLVDRELLMRRAESRFPGEEEIAFRHALLRDGAYALLADHDRALGHRLAGAWLEAHGERDALVLAEHFERGGEPARAAPRYLQAAQKALAGGDPAMIALAERGLACGASGDLRYGLLSLLGRARWMRGDRAGAEAICDEVLRDAPPGSRVHVTTLAGKLFLARQSGNRRRYVEALTAVRDVVPSAQNSAALAELHWAILSFEPRSWDDQLAEQAARVARLVAPLDRLGLGYVATTRGAMAFYIEDDLERAARCYLEGAEHVEAAGGVVIGANIRSHGARIYATLGAYPRAEEEYQRAMGQAGSAGIEGWLMRSSHAWMLAHQGKGPEAVAEAEQLAREAVQQADPAREGQTRYVAALALQRVGEADAAAREAEASLNLPPMFMLQHAEALAILAAARLAQGHVGEALTAAREAMRVEEPPRVRAFLEPLIRLVYVEALTAAGEREAARAARTPPRVRQQE